MLTLDQILQWLAEWNQKAPVPVSLIGVLSLLLIAIVLHRITRRLLIRGTRRWAAQTSSHWDDALVGHRIFRNLSHLVPAFILY
ncbi:MAG: hypothetical protein AAFN07_13775, partial [Pseudomonadota bacterium]